MNHCEYIFPGRGYAFAVGGKKAGLYKVHGLSDGKHGGFILINGVSPLETDTILQHTSINGKKILYTPGRDFGGIEISGEVIMGPGDLQGKRAVDYVQTWFEKSRVGNSGNSVNVSVSSTARKVYLYSMALSQADPQFNIQSFVLEGVYAEPPTRE